MSTEMREPTFFLLMALADGPKHGYGLIAAVRDLSEGRLNLQVGTLYGALERLDRQGWVRESGTEVVGGRHRRYFDLTDEGADALRNETARLVDRAARAGAALRSREEFA